LAHGGTQHAGHVLQGAVAAAVLAPVAC
jgi:hypothetical protein